MIRLACKLLKPSRACLASLTGMKASRGPIGNVDVYHAANAVGDTTDAPGAWGSVDAHHAADDFTETAIALMSYNIGINNTEPGSKNWCLQGGK